MMPNFQSYFIALAVIAIPVAAGATDAKIDAETCSQLRLEQIKFRQSGILDDIQKGPEWAKANLSPDRLREVEHYMMLDEQVKFGCRDAKLSPDAEKAAEAAARIEINSDADPTAPLDLAPEVNGGGPAVDPKAAPAAKPQAKKRTTHKKPKALPPDAQNLEGGAGAAPAAVGSGAPLAAAAPAAVPAAVPSYAGPALGFGDTVVVAPSSPSE